MLTRPLGRDGESAHYHPAPRARAICHWRENMCDPGFCFRGWCLSLSSVRCACAATPGAWWTSSSSWSWCSGL